MRIIQTLKLIVLSGLLISLSSCASILNPKFQIVKIHASESGELLIDGKQPERKKDGYRLERNQKFKQITLKTKGHKDVNEVIVNYKRSPLHIISWIPFGPIFIIPAMDAFPNAFNFDKEITLPEPIKFPAHTESQKNIQLNQVKINLEPEDQYSRFYWFRSEYLKKITKPRKNNESDEEIIVKNSVFSELLNEILKEQGYIDTTRTILKTSFLNDLLIEASVEEYTHNQVASYGTTGFVFVEVKILWKVLDLYLDPIFEFESNVISEHFAYLSNASFSKANQKAIKDAMEIALIEFMNQEKVQQLLQDRSILEEENSMKFIEIPSPTSTATTMNEVVQATVSVKNKKGHGSGFYINNNGYIVTNYHVISDTAGLKVVDSDSVEYSVEIVRSSKIYDLALLKVNTSNPKALKLSLSHDIPLADDVYAVGTPSGEDLAQTITKGIISGIRPNVLDSKLIQTDASINGGNSGGALVNKNKEVIGVVAAKLKGFGIEGVAFGIPAYEIIEKMKLQMK